MIDGSSRVLTIVALVGSGLAAGVFFAFSTFVMTALGRLPDPQGIAAMQAINKAAPSPSFMAVLFGAGLVCGALGVSALTRLDEAGAIGQLLGSALYLACVALTIGYHVPRNNALAVVDPASPGAAAAWRHYRTRWTTWNHVRTLTALGATITFALVLSVD